MVRGPKGGAAPKGAAPEAAEGAKAEPGLVSLCHLQVPRNDHCLLRCLDLSSCLRCARLCLSLGTLYAFLRLLLRLRRAWASRGGLRSRGLLRALLLRLLLLVLQANGLQLRCSRGEACVVCKHQRPRRVHDRLGHGSQVHCAKRSHPKRRPAQAAQLPMKQNSLPVVRCVPTVPTSRLMAVALGSREGWRTVSAEEGCMLLEVAAGAEVPGVGVAAGALTPGPKTDDCK